jgi:hypothetical protein
MPLKKGNRRSENKKEQEGEKRTIKSYSSKE